MVTAYVVLDGFDLGAGVIYPFVAKSSAERRMVLRAIGPVWDGNEVWLLAAGGTLYFAFPATLRFQLQRFLSSLMMVLWLLMLRGIGIEFRAHMDNPVWQGFFDVVFFASSALLAIFFGAALGNVIRGVPLGPDGYFFEPLWTDFRVGAHPGILDWYTVMAGVIALVTLTAHGALYVVTKTEGELNLRARKVALLMWPIQLLLTIVSLIATYSIRPQVMDNYREHPIGMLIPLAGAGESGRDAVGHIEAQREACVRSFRPLHCQHVGRRSVCLVPGGAARQHRSQLQPDDLQLGCGASRPGRGHYLVVHRICAGARLLRFHLPHVPWQGKPRGWRGLLSLGLTDRQSPAHQYRAHDHACHHNHDAQEPSVSTVLDAAAHG